jgi:hypothetical protein
VVGGVMNVQHVDEAIERYVQERMEQGRDRAREHFLADVYLRHGGDELVEFLKKVGGLAKYYINFLKVMENPLKGPEMAWLASMVTVAIYAIILICDTDSRLLGIGLLAGTLVFAGSLILEVVRNWCRIGVTIAIYRELVQLTEREMAGQN